MSLDTYANLKQELIDWSHRDDLDLKIDTFIDLAETEMYANDTEVLQIRSGETRVAFTTSTTDRFVALPTGYQSMRKVRIQITNGQSIELKYQSPSQLQVRSSANMPYFYTIAEQVEMDRISDQAYTGEFLYYQEFTPLSSSNTSNAVLTNFPNIYLFGGMWALKLHAEMPQEAEMYYIKFINAIKGANNKDKLGRYGPAPVMRVETSTP